MTIPSGAAAGSYFYGYDGNGNVAATVNASNGGIAGQHEYGPFGELLRATGPMAFTNPFRFSTKYQDDETGLLYYGYRYYNASTGRWLSRDPINELGANTIYDFDLDTLNSPEESPLYGFCQNDSINSSDVFGLEWMVVRAGGPRAMAFASSSTDTFADLATKVKLDVSDIDKWLRQSVGNQDRPVSPGSAPSPCNLYTIPNTGYIDVGTYTWGGLGWRLIFLSPKLAEAMGKGRIAGQV